MSTISGAHASAVRPARYSRSAILRGLLALGGVVGIGATLTLATYTDSGAAASTFSTGTLDIKIAGVDGISPVYNFATLTTSGLKPGATNYALLPITNAGTLGFTYGMTTGVVAGGTAGTATQDAALVSALQIGIVKLGSDSGTTCNATTYAAASSVSYSTLGAANAAAFSTKTINAGQAADNLCFEVSLPSSAGNSSQGGTANATFSFSATQN